MSMPWERLEQPTCLPRASLATLVIACLAQASGYSRPMRPLQVIQGDHVARFLAGKNHW